MNTLEPISESERWSLQPAVVLLSVPVIMVVFWYFGRMGFFRRELTDVFPESGLSPLYPFIYFSLCSFVLRVVTPVLLILLVLRKPLREFGFGFRGKKGAARTYLLLYLTLLPLILFAGRLESFQAQYPRCGAIIVDNSIPFAGFLVYQACYLLVFVSGEIFWRGYMLFGLRPRFGSYAILIMVIPYTMQHFGKPFPESLGAIAAGTLLGWLALRRGNLWLGIPLHYAVALTMDLVAMACRGLTLG